MILAARIVGSCVFWLSRKRSRTSFKSIIICERRVIWPIGAMLLDCFSSIDAQIGRREMPYRLGRDFGVC